MSFDEIFTSDFFDNVSSISTLDTILILIMSFGIGLYIAFIYRKTYRGVKCPRGFTTTLVALTMITTLMILAITSNAILSLGALGALSVARFRTAIKDTLDIAFLFWSIGAGLVLAAGMITLTIIGNALIGMALIFLNNQKDEDHSYTITLECADSTAEVSAKEFLSWHVERMIVKSRSATEGMMQIVIEISQTSDNIDFINDLSALPGVTSAVIVSDEATAVKGKKFKSAVKRKEDATV